MRGEFRKKTLRMSTRDKVGEDCFLEEKTAKTKSMREQKIYGTRYGQPFELEPVKVKPFIWHVTSKNHRSAIQTNGLLPIKGLLFANNFGHNIENMWPVRFQYDIGYGIYGCDWNTTLKIVEHTMGDRFDFWRIDTRKTNARWFVDPILANEWHGWGLESMYHYVCTPDKVGINTLKLFEFNPEFKEKTYVKRSEGVAHISFNLLPLKMVA